MSDNGIVNREGELIEYEQPRIDEAYRVGDDVLVRLRGPVEAAHQAAAQKIREQRFARADVLEGFLRDDTSLMVRGRLDVVEDPELVTDVRGATYYVGMVHLTDYSDDDPQVIGWETSLAQAWREPKAFGKDVSRTLHFTGDHRKLLHVEEAKYRNGVLEPNSVDPLLARLARGSSGHMKDVIDTIQKDQFDLMEADVREVIVVQGGPGTGKTVVGLHRVSVLLFRSGGDLTEADILVVGPSKVFVEYVKELLPSLGRRHITQVPIGSVGRPSELNVAGVDSDSGRKVKGLAVMKDVMARYRRLRMGIEDAVVELGRKEFARDDIEALIEDGLRRQLSHNEIREHVRSQLLEEVVGRGEPEQAEFLRTHRDDVENLMNRLVPRMSSQELVAGLLSSPKLLAEAADGLLDAGQQAAIARKESAISRVEWTRDDVALIDEAADILGVDRRPRQYHHIVVDEAQDLSPMQLRMLRRRSKGGMTILGDLAQATSPWVPRTWVDHLASAGVVSTVHAELVSGYRTMASVVNYTNRLLPVINVDVPEVVPIQEGGDDPVIVREDDVDGMIERALDFASATIMDDESGGRIGIIATPSVLRGLESELRRLARTPEAIPWARADESLGAAVTLVEADSANGLEFDHVFVLEPTDLYDRDPESGPRLLYVALTRAREGLTLIHTKRLPAVLQDGSAGAGPRPESNGFAVREAAVPDTAEEDWPIEVDGPQPMRVSVLGTSVAVHHLGVETGVVEVARGQAVANGDQMAWALATANGVVALQTSTSPSEAAQQVAGAVRDQMGMA